MTAKNGVIPGSERWKELVKQGIIKDGQRNWFLGDAALEIAPMGATGTQTGAYVNLDAYADEIGVAAGSLRTYRDVAAAWPGLNRVGAASWKVHSMLMAPGNQPLIRDGMTVTEAHRVLGHSTAGRTGPESSTGAKVAQVVALLDDPEVARDAIEALKETDALNTYKSQVLADDAWSRLQAQSAYLVEMENRAQQDDVEQDNRERTTNPTLRAYSGAIDDLGKREDLINELESVIRKLTDMGPVGPDTDFAARLRTASFAVLDLVATEVKRT